MYNLIDEHTKFLKIISEKNEYPMENTFGRFSHFTKTYVQNIQIPGSTRKIFWLNGEPITAVDTNDNEYSTPPGFIFDAHSVPSIFRPLVGDFKSILPAGMHDLDYLLARRRRPSDRNYRLALRWFNEGRINSFFARTGLLFGGWVPHRNHKNTREDLGLLTIMINNTAVCEEEAIYKAQALGL